MDNEVWIAWSVDKHAWLQLRSRSNAIPANSPSCACGASPDRGLGMVSAAEAKEKWAPSLRSAISAAV